MLPPRPEDGHKGTFGTACILGGVSSPPRIMLGGPAFSALAALRVGCGLAVLAVPEPLMNAALTIAPSATGLALPVDKRNRLKPSEVAELLDSYLRSFRCLAVGPGLGAEEPQQQIVVRLIAQDEVPLVLDADAINALAALSDFPRDFLAPAILTPHPGEYERLAQALDLPHDPKDPAQREAAAAALAGRLGCVVVLKGQHTVISDGINTFVNQTGNVSLATAGTGDVLTGIVAGFVAQFFRPNLGAGSRQITADQQGGLSLVDCARFAVELHGRAADAWAEKHGRAGMLATDLLEELPVQMRTMQEQ
ncbi:MAG: NAD(P)H-hydrate dehydratase [Phycisphaerales bacterium]|nr:MAG: NAD(P)H-hydrate dehydratase [Phycisphaerales bacterium]